MEPWLIMGGLIAAFIIIGILGDRAKRKRRGELAAWAGTHGLVFDPAPDHGVRFQHPNFPHLQRGEDQYAYNRMTGTWKERGFSGFDYHYKTVSQDAKGRRKDTHHHFSAVIVRSAIPLKHLHIRSEGLFDRIGQFFGFDDIDFESAEFSARFHVSAKDRKWAYDVLHPRAIEFLLACPTFTLLFDRKSVLAVRGGTFTIQDFEQAAAVVSGLLDQLPNYLVEQQKAQP